MTLLIKACELNYINLELKNGNKIINQQDWFINTNKRSELLLRKIDEFLTKNNFNVYNLTQIKVSPDIKSFTSARVAKCVAVVLMWIIKQRKSFKKYESTI